MAVRIGPARIRCVPGPGLMRAELVERALSQAASLVIGPTYRDSGLINRPRSTCSRA